MHSNLCKFIETKNLNSKLIQKWKEMNKTIMWYFQAAKFPTVQANWKTNVIYMNWYSSPFFVHFFPHPSFISSLIPQFKIYHYASVNHTTFAFKRLNQRMNGSDGHDDRVSHCIRIPCPLVYPLSFSYVSTFPLIIPHS